MSRLQYLAKQLWLGLTARSSSNYWDRRYRAGMTSGGGSYGELAAFKAEVINRFVAEHHVSSVMELGCGDGNQLALALYPRYLGLDVSARAIDLCARRFAHDSTKSFLWYDPERTVNLAGFVAAELTLSLDVIYHLLEDRVYESYLRNLFACSRRFVIVYSSDHADQRLVAHVRHRHFSNDVRRLFPHFRLTSRVPNRYPEQSFAEFFIYADSRTGLPSPSSRIRARF